MNHKNDDDAADKTALLMALKAQLYDHAEELISKGGKLASLNYGNSYCQYAQQTFTMWMGVEKVLYTLLSRMVLLRQALLSI